MTSRRHAERSGAAARRQATGREPRCLELQLQVVRCRESAAGERFYDGGAGGDTERGSSCRPPPPPLVDTCCWLAEVWDGGVREGADLVKGHHLLEPTLH
ncbi:hypothetical protein NQZ68_003205 [Dissostichus eleginoides]|nr:hypothetical protein NQZ68_003205 [Dissostichus eleginoides]